jgi:hypothetical protein
VRPRRDEPKTLDTGRVTLAMRARRTDGERFPFVPHERRSYAAASGAIAMVLAALGLLLYTLLR